MDIKSAIQNVNRSCASETRVILSTNDIGHEQLYWKIRNNGRLHLTTKSDVWCHVTCSKLGFEEMATNFV